MNIDGSSLISVSDVQIGANANFDDLQVDVKRRPLTSSVKLYTITIDFSTTQKLTNEPIPAITFKSAVDPENVITSLELHKTHPKVTTPLMFRKFQTFHYMIIGHSFGGPSGQAELRGNDMFMSLADVGTFVDGHARGTTLEQAGTIMHEIGHNLNLGHGGPRYLLSDPSTFLPDYWVNCKANNQGVMPYSRQLPIFLGLTDYVLDFSHGDTGAVREKRVGPNALDETKGLNDSDGTNGVAKVVWGTPGQAQTFLKGTPDGTGFDWNGDNGGVPDDGIVLADVNNFGINGCGSTAFGSFDYLDYDEWANLDFNFRNTVSGYFDGFHDSVQDINGVIVEQIETAAATSETGALPPADEFGVISGKRGSAINLKMEPLDSNGDLMRFADAFFEVSDGTSIIATGACVQEINHEHCQWNPPRGLQGTFWMTMLLIHESCVDNELAGGASQDDANATCQALAFKRLVTDPPQQFVNDDPSDLPASLKVILTKK